MQRAIVYPSTTKLTVALVASSWRPGALKWCRPALALRRHAVAASQGDDSAAEHSTRNGTALQAKFVDTLSLFSQEYLLAVPFAQRPYLWSTDVAEQLLEDLQVMAGGVGGCEVTELPDFHLGMINLLDKPASSGSFTKKFVYDGQQRIVTLCLLLAALRERLEAAAQGEYGLGEAERWLCRNLAKSLAQKVHQEEDYLIGRPRLPRISLDVQKDTDFLIQLLTEPALLVRSDIVLDGSQQLRLLENIQMFRERLQELPALQCQRLAIYTSTKVIFLVAIISDIRIALSIFTSSMKQGVNMRSIDRMKACVFQNMPEADQERWGIEWNRLERELSPTTPDGKPAGDDLLSKLCCHLISILLDRPGVTNNEYNDVLDVFDVAAKSLRPRGPAGPAFMERVVQPFCQAFRELRSARVERGGAPHRVSYHLRSLSRFLEAGKACAEELTPVALLLLVLHAEQRLSDDRLIAALEQLEALALACTLCKWSKKARRNRCKAVLQGLGYAGATPQPRLQRQHDAVALPEALELSPDEKRALLEALDGPLYPKSNPGLSKPILLRLNEFVLQHSGRDYVQYKEGSTALTVEHVLPQKPAAAWCEEFTEEQHAEWVGRIANLALLSGKKNAGASNRDFRSKRAAYVDKHMVGALNIPLTDDIRSCERWTPAVLEQRQRVLLDTATACWRLHSMQL